MNKNGIMIMINWKTHHLKVINSTENKKTKKLLEISKYQSYRVKRLWNLQLR
jgi:hypothetical protein